MRKLNSAPALKHNEEKQESRRRRTEMPQRNPKLVASLLAEIDTHLNSEEDLGKSAGGNGWARESGGAVAVSR